MTPVTYSAGGGRRKAAMGAAPPRRGFAAAPPAKPPCPPSRGSCYSPRPASIEAAGGTPRAVGDTPVEAVREEWVVEDRWWTSSPLRRRYFELALGDGRCVVVFYDLEDGRWFAQRA